MIPVQSMSVHELITELVRIQDARRSTRTTTAADPTSLDATENEIIALLQSRRDARCPASAPTQ